MRQVLLFIIAKFIIADCFCQQKVYNNKVINPQGNVYFNIHVDSQIIHNPTPITAKLYLLEAKTAQQLIVVPGSKHVKIGKTFFTMKIGNPDSQIVYDPNFDIEFIPGFDTAYFDEPKYFYSFDKKGVRDQSVTFSKDKRHILYKASYFGAGYVKVLHVICSDPDPKFRYKGLGSLF